MQTGRRVAAWSISAAVFAAGNGATVVWLVRRYHDPGLIGLAAGVAAIGWTLVAATCFGVLRPRS